MDLLLELQVKKKVNWTKNRFFYKQCRDSKNILAMMHARMTEGVNPVISMKKIKNIVLKSFILRFEAFNLLRIVVIPIITKPHVCARYC